MKTCEKNVSASISHRLLVFFHLCKFNTTFTNIHLPIHEFSVSHFLPSSQHSILSMHKCNSETTRANFTCYELLPSCEHVASHEHDICYLNNWNGRGKICQIRIPRTARNNITKPDNPFYLKVHSEKHSSSSWSGAAL